MGDRWGDKHGDNTRAAVRVENVVSSTEGVGFEPTSP